MTQFSQKESTGLSALKSESRRRVPEEWCTKDNPLGQERAAVRTRSEGHTYPFLPVSTATQRPCRLQAEGRLMGGGTTGHISLQPDNRMRMCTQQFLHAGRTQAGGTNALNANAIFRNTQQWDTVFSYPFFLPTTVKSGVSIFIRRTSDFESSCIFIMSSIPLS